MMAESPERATAEARVAASAMASSERREAAESALASESFGLFLRRSAAMMERVLHAGGGEAHPALFKDYAASPARGGRGEGADAGDADALALSVQFGARTGAGARRASAVGQIADNLTHDCGAVMDMAWSPEHPELLLVAHGGYFGWAESWGGTSATAGAYAAAAAPHGAGGSPGLMRLWSLALPSRPEFEFRSDVPVCSATWVPSTPQLVIGGSRTGQLLVWDMRAHAEPVQVSGLAGGGHTQAVHSVAVVGATRVGAGGASGRQDELLSAGMDGRLCAWALASLDKPIDAITLDALPARGAAAARPALAPTGPLSVSAMAISGYQGGMPLVGAQDGGLHLVARPGVPNAGVRASFAPHASVVTAIDAHPASAAASADLHGSLALTASVDWTVRLWQLADVAELGGAAALGADPDSASEHLRGGGGAGARPQPVLTLDNANEYVCDVRWSPLHAAAFATADAAGCVSLWDLARNDDEPVCRTALQTAHAAAAHKLAWHCGGQLLAVGDTCGGVHVYSVGVHSADEAAAAALQRLLAAPRGGDFLSAAVEMAWARETTLDAEAEQMDADAER